jgi:hypothetical protein
MHKFCCVCGKDLLLEKAALFVGETAQIFMPQKALKLLPKVRKICCVLGARFVAKKAALFVGKIVQNLMPEKRSICWRKNVDKRA